MKKSAKPATGPGVKHARISRRKPMWRIKSRGIVKDFLALAIILFMEVVIMLAMAGLI